MNLQKFFLTDEEAYVILDYRAEEKKKKKKKGVMRKYVFNKYLLFDARTALMRESIKYVFMYFVFKDIIDKVK